MKDIIDQLRTWRLWKWIFQEDLLILLILQSFPKEYGFFTRHVTSWDAFIDVEAKLLDEELLMKIDANKESTFESLYLKKPDSKYKHKNARSHVSNESTNDTKQDKQLAFKNKNQWRELKLKQIVADNKTMMLKVFFFHSDNLDHKKKWLQGPESHRENEECECQVASNEEEEICGVDNFYREEYERQRFIW